jgi:hypothetical protein
MMQSLTRPVDSYSAGQKIILFQGIPRLSNVFTQSCHRILFCASWIQSISSQIIPVCQAYTLNFTTLLHYHTHIIITLQCVQL